MKKYSSGFSLIEIMVVIVIIGIISSFTYVSFSKSSVKGRDAERQSDLRTLQTAIELYKNKNGRYPEGCKGPGVWSGQAGTSYECSTTGGPYIVGLAPEFIPKLPTDPKLNGDKSGYVYATNADGTVYKLMVKKTVESEVVTDKHEFKSCDVLGVSVGICATVLATGSLPDHCNQSLSPQFKTSYAVWGGYAEPITTAAPATAIYKNQRESLTEKIICELE